MLLLAGWWLSPACISWFILAKWSSSRLCSCRRRPSLQPGAISIGRDSPLPAGHRLAVTINNKIAAAAGHARSFSAMPLPMATPVATAQLKGELAGRGRRAICEAELGLWQLPCPRLPYGSQSVGSPKGQRADYVSTFNGPFGCSGVKFSPKSLVSLDPSPRRAGSGFMLWRRG